MSGPRKSPVTGANRAVLSDVAARLLPMTAPEGIMVGYARVSTDRPGPHRPTPGPRRARRRPDRVHVDHGLTGTNRAGPGPREAMAACRRGDTLVVTKLDRLARSVPDARDIVDELTACGVRGAWG